LEGEILATLEGFQKSKIPGMDSFYVEFFLGFYDLLKEDLLKVIQESQSVGKVHGSLNNIFMALTPKKRRTPLLKILDPSPIVN